MTHDSFTVPGTAVNAVGGAWGMPVSSSSAGIAVMALLINAYRGNWATEPAKELLVRQLQGLGVFLCGAAAGGALAVMRRPGR